MRAPAPVAGVGPRGLGCRPPASAGLPPRPPVRPGVPAARRAVPLCGHRPALLADQVRPAGAVPARSLPAQHLEPAGLPADGLIRRVGRRRITIGYHAPSIAPV
jgi:hypothetical protein